ncbi:DUF3179 domain-containing protein [Natrinema salsiterrestre]|uniref:DUF3179 domain-containing protein n=1 Tax=Natrinema salsiterrestre TaxID=2950540 RepID=A0A9Q4L499_9EURY|nr:DUF3179 domain-containing protein [Natrinema salsiterrestre]MDF9747049.1 DUF3179 domain-containing protein [Natrinema salsiterrestre]
MNVIDVLPRDAIPSIDEPSFGSEYGGDPDDDVLVVDGDPPRAYPIRILNYHEIVNDEIDGRPIAVTWCPICGSAIVYDRIVDDRRLSFGVSGKLADDDLVLYDRETESEWKQSTGECIAGELAGERLTMRPGPMTTYEAFREDYPDGVVLQPEAGSDAAVQNYDSSGYDDYARGDGFGLSAMRGVGPDREWSRDDLEPKTVVLGIERDGEALGFPVPIVESAGGALEATVGDTDILVVSTDAGIHAFEEPGFSLRLDEGGRLVGDGTAWSVATGASGDGRRLRRVPAKRLYAFGWQDDHGPDAFYQLSA